MKSLCNHTTSIYNEKYVVERLLTTIAEIYQTPIGNSNCLMTADDSVW
jgi:hypothetical protein